MSSETLVCPLLTTTEESNDVADLVRMHVLVTLFSGDPDRWIAEIEGVRQPGNELQGDLAFLTRVRRAIRSDHTFARAMEAVVEGVADVLRGLRSDPN